MCGIGNVDDAEAGLAIGHIGPISGYEHALRLSGRGQAAHLLGMCGIAHIQDDEMALIIVFCEIGVAVLGEDIVA